MSELEPVGQTWEIKRYNLGRMQKYQPPSRDMRRNPPAVKPEELPDTTMRRIFQDSDLKTNPDYNLLVSLLMTYQRAGDIKRWDDYRGKIPGPLLELFGDILVECRRNGFVNPKSDGIRIAFQQVISTTEITGDLCTLCDKFCTRREQLDNGEIKKIRNLNKNNPNWKEPKPCWEKNNESS